MNLDGYERFRIQPPARDAVVGPVVVALFVLALGAGCDKGSSSSSSSSRSASSPPVAVNVAPATEPMAAIAAPATVPATQPMATLDIGGNAVEFPPAKLVITKKSGGIDAILCSDDPPNAIQSNYAGNSFMIEMKLDIEDPADLPTAVWEFKTDKREPQDSTTGIFLNGSKRQMQPADVRVTFAKDGDHLVASVGGKFVLFDSTDVSAPVQLVDVNGKLNAVVHEQ
jgi:hypothetical protein